MLQSPVWRIYQAGVEEMFLTKPFRTLVPFTGLMLVAWACQSSPERDSFSITARARQTANPKTAVFLIQSQDAFSQGNYLWAMVFIDSAEKYAPELADIHYQKGNIFFQVGQLEPARRAYAKVAQIDSNYRSIWFKRGNVEFADRNYTEAIALYQKELSVVEAEEKALGVKRDVERYYFTYFQLGLSYKDLGQRDSAKLAFRFALQEDSTAGEVYGEMAGIFRDEGEYETALAYARKAYALAPEDQDHNYLMGLLLWRTGAAEEAVKHLRKEIIKHPDNSGAYYNLGQVLMQLGNLAEGQEYIGLTDSIRVLNTKIKVLQITAENYRHNLMVWVNLGDACYQAGRYSGALEAYRNALFLDPVNLWAQHRMANLLLRAGDIQGAIHRYEVILEIGPQLTDVWIDLGIAHALRGAMVEARWAWRKAMNIDPDNALAKQYLEQGRIQP